MPDFRERLTAYLNKNDQPFDIAQLTPDASTREYFRVSRQGETTIACVYPEAFLAAEQSYLDVTKLFVEAGLPVAEVIDFDESLGVILLEDLGDLILRDALVSATPEKADQLLNEAIALIAKIQAATDVALNSGSVAGKLRFDAEKLGWELDFFREHYFGTLNHRPLDATTANVLSSEFERLASLLESRASVLCHRDFHAANLMIREDGSLAIIDHQDARIGSAAYDLVSLLLDRVTEPPSSEWLAAKRQLFLSERSKLGLAPIDDSEFAAEFRLQTIQRCLKAVGTFSYQSSVRGKSYFLPFIRPMLAITHRAVVNVGIFPEMLRLLEGELNA